MGAPPLIPRSQTVSCIGALRHIPGAVNVFPPKATVQESTERVVGKPQVFFGPPHYVTTRVKSFHGKAG
jgi:hypothetical protein